MTTKILALTDALGNLVRFVLMPGQRFDTVGVAPLLKDIEFGALIADKAFDSNDIIADLRSTPKCINGVIWSRTSSANSRNSNASRCGPIKPTEASRP
jgi:transposase